MGFLITTLIFIAVGVIACLFARICCNRGPSTNLYTNPWGFKLLGLFGKRSPKALLPKDIELADYDLIHRLPFVLNAPNFIDMPVVGLTMFHLTLVITATVCCWMMWAIVYLAQLNPLIVPILSGE